MITSRFSKVFWSPLNIVTDVNNICNLQCIMCHPQLVKKENKSWSFDNFKFVLKDFNPRSVVLGASGEPLLNSDLKYMADFSKNKGFKNILSTNGIMLKQNLEWISKSVDVLKLSLDASTDNTYRKIRQNPNFHKILESLKIIDSPEVRLEFVIMSQNYKELESFVKLAKLYHIRYVFFRILNSEGLPEETIKSLTNVPNLQDEIEKAYSKAKELKIKTNLKDLLDNIGNVVNHYRNLPIEDSRRDHVCLLPWVQLYVSVNGECSCCCNLTEMGKISTGNIFKGENVWNGKKMQNLRKLFSSRKNYDTFKECSECEYLSFSRLLTWTRLVPNWF